MRRKPTSEAEIAEEVADRLQGGPRRRMHELADQCDMEYERLLGELDDYVAGDADYISLGVDTPYDLVERMWDDWELITGRVCPTELRQNPFSCSC